MDLGIVFGGAGKNSVICAFFDLKWGAMTADSA